MKCCGKLSVKPQIYSNQFIFKEILYFDLAEINLQHPNYPWWCVLSDSRDARAWLVSRGMLAISDGSALWCSALLKTTQHSKNAQSITSVVDPWWLRSAA